MAVNSPIPARGRPAPRSSGFTLIEVLIALLITTLGLLGLAGLQTRLQQAEFESYQRTQALVLLYDMVDRVRTNRATLPCFAITTNTASGVPYLGTGAAAAPACGFSNAANNAIADATILEWDNLLKGAAETAGGVSVGAMIGARGCVSYDATTEL
ncbi:MAG: type IV pilus modification protein PilV, partial [Betaproteobacteria bacterium]|nr:type IV pilus modification protein PilV [Betaproteobacteria bacterium]